jgi:polysaccharide export outer membrane protein
VSFAFVRALHVRPSVAKTGAKLEETKMKMSLLRFVAGLLMLCAVGWSAAQKAAPAPGAGASPSTTARTDYVLGAGDVIRISVFQSPELTLETRIPESGAINYPLLGAVNLGGLSISQAEKRLADGLLNGRFLKQPQVSILVIQLRGSQASVLGHAVRPGRYTLELTNTRLSDLMALAGGVAPDGNDILTVVGTRDGQPYRKQIDFRTLFRGGGNAEDDIIIQNNDVVYVDRAPEIYIYGEVQKPGAIRLDRGMTVMQAIAAGGGLTAKGTQRGVRVHRKGADGALQELTVQLQDQLQPNDVVYVRESLF